MAFTAGELASIANASLDYYFNRGDLFKQSIQAKPLIKKLESKAKTFPGGKGDISLAVKGNYGDGSGDDVLKGYTHDDAVDFYTPANIDRAVYPWRETHIGLTVTYTELKIDGLTVADEFGAQTNQHSDREMTVLVNLLEDKMEDIGEQYLRGLNGMFWDDGTADALGFAGLQSIIVDDPATGVVGGIDGAVEAWWRNRALVGAPQVGGLTGAIYIDPADGGLPDGGTLARKMQNEIRQLRRYGGRPDCFFCGSEFMDQMESEFRANGYYSDNGFSGGKEMGVGEMKFKGMTMTYDPTLDDLGYEARAYVWDSRDIFLEKMEGEWRRNHNPARPENQFVIHRSITSTGQIVATRRNSSGVYEISGTTPV